MEPIKKTVTISLFIGLITILSTQNINGTHGYSWLYRFTHFEYSQSELMGSLSIAPDMFSASCELNNYVLNKIEKKELDNKPVIYKINDNYSERKQFALEVYETNRAYYVNINYKPFMGIPFTKDELIDVIDYLSHPEFNPFYCDTTLINLDLAKEIFFNKIGPIIKQKDNKFNPSTFSVYQLDDLRISYINSTFKAFWDNKEIEIELTPPVAYPFKFKDRIIIIDSASFFVLEGGEVIKQIKAPYLLWDGSDGETDTNIPNINIYPDWLNILNQYDDSPRYSYSYSKNRLYVCDDN